MFVFLKPIKWVVKLAMLLVLLAAAYVVFCAVGVVRAESSTPPAGAGNAPVVVTGAATAGGAPEAALLGRLQAALPLAQASGAPIVAAGPGQAATVAAGWLAAHGYHGHVEQVMDSASYSQIARDVGAGRAVVIVTDAVDARFALDAAASAGLHPSASVVPGSKKLFVTELGALFREASGVAAGHVIGYGRASWAAG